MNRRRGRPANYVRDRDGKPVVGLSYHRSSGRYYSTHERPPTYFGRDLDVAIMQFRAHEASDSTVVMPVQKPVIPSRRAREASISEGWIRRSAAERLIPWPELIEEEAIWKWVREQIIADPKRVAQRVAIPAVAYLGDLHPPEPSLTLVEVEANYFARKMSMNRISAADQRRHWTEFKRIVAAKTIRDITRDDIERYHDHVWKQAEKRKWSPSTIRHRLDAPKTMLRASLKRGRDLEQLRRVIDLMAIFERPAAPATDPRPLSRDDLHVLLDAALVKMRAAILLALNVAAYPSEVVGIKKSELDLDAKHYVGRRNKTGITRIAVLWDRTVKAVREYMQAEPHDGETLFVNAVGAELTQRSLTQQFRDLRRRIGLSDDVRFDSLRDGAYTAAIEGGATIDEARMLAGHRVGIPDHYLRRKPSMVADACAAIEQHYFGSTAKSARRALSGRKR